MRRLKGFPVIKASGLSDGYMMHELLVYGRNQDTGFK